ncbi:amino acid adenylation domain-containing protein [Nocardia gipuzkoensis]
MTTTQQAYLVGRGDTVALGNVSTHAYIEYDLEVDPTRFAAAWDVVFERHEMLRAVVDVETGSQCILAEVPDSGLIVDDLREVDATARDAALAHRRSEMSHEVRPCDEFPLFGLVLSVLPGGRARLHVGIDGLTIDYASWFVLLRDLSLAYAGRAHEMKPITSSFREYVVQAESLRDEDEKAGAMEYWERRLPDLPGPPQLPLAAELESIGQPRFERLEECIPAETWHSLQRAAVSHGLSPSGVLIAAFALVVASWSSTHRFTLSVPSMGRNPLFEGVEDLVGEFATFTLVEVDSRLREPFSSFAGRVQRDLWEALEHGAVSGVELLRKLRDSSPSPTGPVLMPVVFTSLLAYSMEDSTVFRDMTIAYQISQTPQVYLDIQTEERDSGLRVNWDHVSGIFRPGVVESMFEQWMTALGRLAMDPDEWESEDLLRSSDVVEAQPPARYGEISEDLVHTDFLRQVEAQPNAPAVITTQGASTYRALYERARMIATHLERVLSEYPAQYVDPIAIILTGKSSDQIAAAYGALLADCAYLPVDPDSPQQIIRGLIDRSRPFAVVVDTSTAASVEDAGVPVLDLDQLDPAAMTPTAVRRARGPRDLAYVLPTSGSTGEPKLVAIEHAGVVHCLRQTIESFDIGAGDRSLAVTPFHHDMSLFDTFCVLGAGGSVVVPDAERRTDPDHWLDLIERYQPTLWTSVPSMMAMLIEAIQQRGTAAECLRLSFLGGDWLSHALATSYRRTFRNGTLVSVGGPTETTIWNIWHRVDGTSSDSVSVLYGRPIPGAGYYILDERRVARPAWVVGEMYCTGIGLARGYLDDPELTRDRFTIHPVTGERMYRTGDLGRFRPDGTIEFIGRVDSQINLHGRRIELSAIESALRSHPDIDDAVVTPAAGRSEIGYTVLVAHVITSSVLPSSTEIRTALADRLPKYMIPHRIRALDSFPLTPSKKVDRKELELQGFEFVGDVSKQRPKHREYVEPRDADESVLAGLFAEILGVDTVGVHDDFFDLGGHSLLAIRLSARVRKVFGAEISLSTVFDFPTVSELMPRIDFSSSELVPAIRDSDATEGPLSSSQRRLWFFYQVEGASAVYNIPLVAHFDDEIEVDALSDAVRVVVGYHQILRTVYEDRDGDPVQRVVPVADITVPIIVAEESGEAAGREFFLALAGREFDLMTQAPLALGVVHRGGRGSDLILVVHHIAADGSSLHTLLRDLLNAYAARIRGAHPAVRELPIQYIDYARWQQDLVNYKTARRESIHRQSEYWVSELGGLPDLVTIDADHPRPERNSYRGTILTFSIPPSLGADIESLIRTSGLSGLTATMVFHAAFAGLLAKSGAGLDLAIGFPVSGRNDEALSDAVGFFVNTLVLRVDLAADPTFLDLLAIVRAKILGALANQDIPFEQVVDAVGPVRSPAWHPLFQVALSVDERPLVGSEHPGVRISAEPVATGTSRFDLFISLSRDHAAGGYTGVIEYSTDLFERRSIEVFARRFVRTLSEFTRDPATHVGALDVLEVSERTEVLAAGRGRPTSPDRPTVLELFGRQVLRQPEAAAVVAPSGTLSYADLRVRALALARRMTELGVGPEVVVAIALPRSAEMVVALLAVLEAGGAYLPIDLTYPTDRIEGILHDARPAVVLTDRGTSLPSPGTDIKRLHMDEFRDVRPDDELYLAKSEGSQNAARPQNLCYLIYTSGSTGKPKCVGVAHQSLAAMVEHTRLGGPGDRILSHSSLAFDAAVLEIWPALCHGATLVLSTGPSADIAEICRLITVHRVTGAFCTPALLALLTQHWKDVPRDRPTGLVRLSTGADVLPDSVVDDVLEELPGIALENLYGPTEATVFVTKWEGRSREAYRRSVPIGSPVDNARVHVLDSRLMPVPVGVVGELYLSGPQLARGYRGSPGRTAEAFVADPIGGRGERMYRSGDLVRWTAEHELEYVGRADGQVKIRGYRVELGEIESVLRSHRLVRQAVATVRDDCGAGRSLVAYVTLKNPTAEAEGAQSTELRDYVAGLLPDYMVPVAVSVVALIPLSPNGKIDYRKLPRPLLSFESGTGPRNEYEEIVAAIFADLLNVDSVGTDDNFFTLGGNSLAAAILVRRIASVSGIELRLPAVIESPTVSHIARLLAGK